MKKFIEFLKEKSEQWLRMRIAFRLKYTISDLPAIYDFIKTGELRGN